MARHSLEVVENVLLLKRDPLTYYKIVTVLLCRVYGELDHCQSKSVFYTSAPSEMADDQVSVNGEANQNGPTA